MVAMVHGVATVVVAAVRNSGGLGVAVVEVAASECGDGCGPCGRRGQRPRGGCSEQREGAGAGRRLGARGWRPSGRLQIDLVLASSYRPRGDGGRVRGDGVPLGKSSKAPRSRRSRPQQSSSGGEGMAMTEKKTEKRGRRGRR